MGIRRIRFDDLTGEDTAADELVTVTYLFDDLEGTFEGTQASVDALKAMFGRDDSSEVRALLAPKEAPKSPGKAKSTKPRKSGGEHAQTREWCGTAEGKAAVLRTGKQPTDKGRMPEALIAAWREATGHAA